jgi:hypothetical protein
MVMATRLARKQISIVNALNKVVRMNGIALESIEFLNAQESTPKRFICELTGKPYYSNYKAWQNETEANRLYFAKYLLAIDELPRVLPAYDAKVFMAAHHFQTSKQLSRQLLRELASGKKLKDKVIINILSDIVSEYRRILLSVDMYEVKE